MNIQKAFPYLVAGYTVVVGLFFLISSLIDTPFLNAAPPGSHILLVVSIIFIAIGSFYTYLLHKGKLTRTGRSIVEIRQKAIEKLEDPAMLSKIALEDSNPKYRKAAKERLEDLEII